MLRWGDLGGVEIQMVPRSYTTGLRFEIPFRVNIQDFDIVVEDDSLVNCDKTEVVGRQIYTSLDEVELSAAKIKISDAVKNLDSLYNIVTLDKKQVSINSNLLFNRLTAVAGRDDVDKYFEFELIHCQFSKMD